MNIEEQLGKKLKDIFPGEHDPEARAALADLVGRFFEVVGMTTIKKGEHALARLTGSPAGFLAVIRSVASQCVKDEDEQTAMAVMLQEVEFFSLGGLTLAKCQKPLTYARHLAYRRFMRDNVTELPEEEREQALEDAGFLAQEFTAGFWRDFYKANAASCH